jgi:patatin-related protein
VCHDGDRILSVEERMMADNSVNNGAGVKELRFAVTMNGGVSLAVYMGGVTQELNLISKAVPQATTEVERSANPYGRLLRMIGFTAPVIDIITGTSAGGINGAALAVAQANVNGDIGVLKPLWLMDAQIESMLRPPFRSGAPSLLKGDDYFLPLLQRAFQQMTTPEVYTRSEVDIELSLTTTLLRPRILTTPDDYGMSIVERDFAGLLTFKGSRGGLHGDRDDFAAENIGRTARALALAARASAGFPVAFEPAFLPVDEPVAVSGRPDMSPYANWRKLSREAASRYGVDGGLLNNTPTMPALAAIKHRRATGKFIRRVLILIHPHAEDAAMISDEPDRAGDPPTLTAAIQRMAQATTSVGSRAYIREIRQHNDNALRRRDGRELAAGKFTEPLDLAAFLAEKGPAWQLFREMRMRRNALFMAGAVPRSVGQSLEDLQGHALSFLETEDRSPSGLPYLPKEPPTAARRQASAGWPWGIALATGVVTYLVQLLREIDHGLESPAAPDYFRKDVAAVWSEAVNTQAEINRLGEELEEKACAAARAIDGGREEQFGAYLEVYRQELTPPSGKSDGSARAGQQVATLIDTLLQRFLTYIVTPLRVAQNPLLQGLLKVSLLRTAASVDQLLPRLLGIEVVSYLLSENAANTDGSGERSIELFEHTARTAQHFAPGWTADDKLAGMALGRFGAFFKQAWRSNDWIWGRLDAVKTLMCLLLTSETIVILARRRGLSDGMDEGQCRSAADGLVNDIARSAFADDAAFEALKQCRLADLSDRAIDEVTDALRGKRSGQLPCLASLAAYGAQIAIAAEEVPFLRAAVLDDRRRGAVGARAERFLDDLDGLRSVTRDSNAPAGYRELLLFANAGIGQEEIGEQIPSDALIRTASTAMATTATVLASPASGLGFARGLTMGLRGAVGLPYWIIVGLTHTGQLARIAAAAVLALGVSLVTISLIVPLHGVLAGLLPVLGFGSLLAISVYGAMRTRSFTHVAALLGLLVPLMMLGVNEGEKQQTSASAGADSNPAMGWLAVGCVAVIVVGAVVIANLSSPIHSPLSTGLAVGQHALKLLRRSGKALAKIGVAAAAVIALAWTTALWVQRHGGWRDVVVNAVGERWLNRLTPVFANFPFCAAVYIGATAVGFVMAVALSRRLRPADRPATPGSARRTNRLTDPTGLAIAWAAFYGALYAVLTWVLVAVTHRTDPWPPSPSWISLGIALAFSLLIGPTLWWQSETRLIERLARRLDADERTGKRQDTIHTLLASNGDHAYLFTKDGSTLSPAGWRIRRKAELRRQTSG